MINKGIKFKWFIIGFGAERELNKIYNEIKRYNVDKEIILLYKKVNPYPYIKVYDWYIQPSRYEGKSITVQEAQILGKPVIIRNYPTASSQIIDGIDGFIGSYDLAYFAKDLFRIIKDKEGIERVKHYLSSKEWTQTEDLNNFYNLALSI